MLESIIYGAGAMASIIGVLSSIKKATKLMRWLFVIIFFMAALNGYLSYQNYLHYSKEKLFENAGIKAGNLYKEFSYIDKYEPGKNEGITNTGLAFFERYRELFPDTYNRLNTDIEVIKKKIQEIDISYKKDEYWDNAANAVVTTLRGISVQTQ